MRVARKLSSGGEEYVVNIMGILCTGSVNGRKMTASKDQGWFGISFLILGALPIMLIMVGTLCYGSTETLLEFLKLDGSAVGLPGMLLFIWGVLTFLVSVVPGVILIFHKNLWASGSSIKLVVSMAAALVFMDLVLFLWDLIMGTSRGLPTTSFFLLFHVILIFLIFRDLKLAAQSRIEKNDP